MTVLCNLRSGLKEGAIRGKGGCCVYITCGMTLGRGGHETVCVTKTCDGEEQRGVMQGREAA